MYLYKYLFKGPDRTLFSLNLEGQEEIDEIKDYINARYLSASEAAWKILQYDLTDRSPTVKSLAVHLPGRNLHRMCGTGGGES